MLNGTQVSTQAHFGSLLGSGAVPEEGQDASETNDSHECEDHEIQHLVTSGVVI